MSLAAYKVLITKWSHLKLYCMQGNFQRRCLHMLSDQVCDHIPKNKGSVILTSNKKFVPNTKDVFMIPQLRFLPHRLRSRSLIWAFLLCIMSTYIGIGTPVRAQVSPSVSIVLSAQGEDEGVRLSWSIEEDGADVLLARVYRRSGPTTQFEHVRSLPPQDSTYLDPDRLYVGETYEYYVTLQVSDLIERIPSNRVRFVLSNPASATSVVMLPPTPSVVTPNSGPSLPEPLVELNATPQNGSIGLQWTLKDPFAFILYRIYRRKNGESAYTRVSSTPPEETVYLDADLENDAQYYLYYITIRDEDLNEQVASNKIQVFTKATE